MTRYPLIILGGGISGLAAAQEARALGAEPLILEAAPGPGGLTRSVHIGEFSFDYTGHLLHLARCSRPSEVPHAHLRDDDWQQIDRRSTCFIGGAMVPAPVQYNLSGLPNGLREACIASYDERPRYGEATNFRDFVVQGFGERLAREFLIPQNEKTQAIPLERLSMDAIKRFFPAPDEERVRAGMDPGHQPPQEYNSRFWYPRIGGIDRLVHGLATGLDDIRLLEQATAIDLLGRRITTASGKTFPYQRLISTIPLKALATISGDQQLQAHAADLTHSSTVVFNLGVSGPPEPPLREAHWVYVPQRELPFYRVGVYSNISTGVCPPDSHALYVEVGLPSDQVGRTNLLEQLQAQVIVALKELGWLKPERVQVAATNVIRCAYVHHTPEREAAVTNLTAMLRRQKVEVGGRYGLWDYISMEDSIHSGIAAARRQVGEASKSTSTS